jgi:hypothetical protein
MMRSQRIYKVAYLSLVIMTSDSLATGEAMHSVIAPPSCSNNQGEPVLFISRSGLQGRVAAGMANRDTDGTPVIYRMNYDKATPAFQRFVDFHECAHHQVGHVDQLHPPRNSFEHLMNESIADCVAILRVREEANESFDGVIEGLKTAMALVGFPKISTDSRISNVTNCYQDHGSSAEFIESVLNQSGAN